MSSDFVSSATVVVTSFEGSVSTAATVVVTSYEGSVSIAEQIFRSLNAKDAPIKAIKF